MDRRVTETTWKLVGMMNPDRLFAFMGRSRAVRSAPASRRRTARFALFEAELGPRRVRISRKCH